VGTSHRKDHEFAADFLAIGDEFARHLDDTRRRPLGGAEGRQVKPAVEGRALKRGISIHPGIKEMARPLCGLSFSHNRDCLKNKPLKTPTALSRGLNFPHAGILKSGGADPDMALPPGAIVGGRKRLARLPQPGQTLPEAAIDFFSGHPGPSGTLPGGNGGIGREFFC
jgi:hypothetical protein